MRMDKKKVIENLDVKAFYSSELPSIKWNGSGMGQALCPFHEDHKPSLSVNLRTGQFRCFGCNKAGSVFDFYMARRGVDFRTAFNILAKESGLITETQRKLVKTYNYIDESGRLLFQSLRYEPKEFKQRKPDGKGGWIWNLQGVKLVPYSLPDVLKAETVFITEGEKDADNLNALGFTATTNPMGAGKWRSEYNQYFKDKKVAIIPDNDPQGKDHAQTIAKNLKGIAESVKIAELPDLPEKGDVSNWLKKGGTKERLLEIIKDTPEWIPGEPKEKSLLESLLKWNDILTLDIRTEYLLQGLIPKGSITMLFGRGGIGKTSLCLQIARAVAEGIALGDLQTIKTPVYYIDFENPLSVLKERVEKIGHTDNLWVWHISNNPMPPKLDSKDWELYKQLPPGLLIFDTMRASHLLDEDKSKDMALLLCRLKELREMGFDIVFLQHTPKGNEGIYKGSTALLDLADHVLGLEGLKDEDTVEFGKDNIYRFGVRIKTRYEPYHIFLKFNPDIKGFEIAKDPDYEKIEAIYEILRESSEPLKQKELKEKVKTELDLTEGETRRLLKKGEGIAWDIQKGGEKGRALIYTPKSNRIIGQPIYSHPIIPLKPEGDKTPSNNNPSDNTQTLDNTKLDNRTDSVYPINQLEFLDLEHKEVEIIK